VTRADTTRGWRDDRRVTDLLDEADLLHVAVTARRGVHVTPAVFEREGRRLWFVTPRRSVKAKAIRRHRLVGGLVQVGERAVMFNGRARVVDPFTGRGIFSVDRLLDMPLAGLGYLGRNHKHAVGAVRDHKAPTLALSRVTVSIDVARVALLEGPRVVATWGRWERLDLLLHGSAPESCPPDLESVPPSVRSLVSNGDAGVVLGWQSTSGPLALPGRWRVDTGLVETSGAGMVLAGAGTAGAACITAERSGHRLKSKRGLLLAGPGRARLDGETAHVAVDQARITWWEGEESRTVASPAPS
jgi:hypothetical protein